MNNTFLNKVSAERSVLSIINARTKGVQQLTGLSAGAIQVWSQRLGIAESDIVTSQLMALAELCQCLSDRSHETFMPIDSSLENKINAKMEDLRKAVNNLSERLTIR